MAEHPALVAAARHGLASRAPDPAVRLDDEDLQSVVEVARIDRLGGFLATAIADGVVAATDQARETITDLWHDQLVVAVLAETLALRAAAHLDDGGVAWRLTKGPALAHLDYPDPAVRLFGDVDVVVHPASWDRALEVLAGEGWRRESAELNERFDQSFGKGATIISPEGYELDLHRRLAIGRFGVRLPTEALFTDAAAVTLGGRRLPVLDGPSRLIHACYHATLGGFRHLRAHRDVAQLLLVSVVDWRAAQRTTIRHGVEAVMARAIVDSWSTLDLTVSHPALTWARQVPIGRADAHALRVFAEERRFSEQALTAVPVLVGRGATRYLWALAGQGGRHKISPAAVLRRAGRAVRGH